MRQINRLNEEIARWRFEISLRDSSEWYIAFTNPTAGPWKTISAINNEGIKGEVYRFILEEDRPDIIIYNDKLKVIIIIEAKDSLSKLMEETQLKKSCNVAIKIGQELIGKDQSPFWGKRSEYTTYLGLLWGTTAKENKSDIKKLFDSYYNQIKNNRIVNENIIIGIESIFSNNMLEYHVIYETYNNEYNKTAVELQKSLSN